MSDQPSRVPLPTTITSATSPRNNNSNPHVATSSSPSPAPLLQATTSVLSATASAGRASTLPRLTAEQTIHSSSTPALTAAETTAAPLYAATLFATTSISNKATRAASVAPTLSSGSAHSRSRRVLRANPVAVTSNVIVSTSSSGGNVPVLVSSEETLMASASNKRPTLQAQTNTAASHVRRSSNESTSATGVKPAQPRWVRETNVSSSSVVPLTSHNLHTLTATEQTASTTVIVGGRQKEGNSNSETRRDRAESVTTKAAPAAFNSNSNSHAAAAALPPPLRSTATANTNFLFAAEETTHRATTANTTKAPVVQPTHRRTSSASSTAASLPGHSYSVRRGSAQGTNSTKSTTGKSDNWQRLRQEHEQRVRASEGGATSAAQLPWWMSPALQPFNTNASGQSVNNINNNAGWGNTNSGQSAQHNRTITDGSIKGGFGATTTMNAARRTSTSTNKEGSVYDTGRVTGQGTNETKPNVAYTFTVTEKKQSALPRLTASASSGPVLQQTQQQTSHSQQQLVNNESVFMGARHAVSTNPLNIWQHEGAFLRNIFGGGNKGTGNNNNDDSRRNSGNVLTSLQSGGVRAAQNVTSAVNKTFSAVKGAATGLLMASETTATAHAAGTGSANTKRNAQSGGSNSKDGAGGLSDVAIAEALLLAQQQQAQTSADGNVPVTQSGAGTQGQDTTGLRRRTTSKLNGDYNGNGNGNGNGKVPPSLSSSSAAGAEKGNKPSKDNAEDRAVDDGTERRPALKVGTRTYRTRNLNALHAFSWDRRVFLPRTLGWGASAFQLFASPRFWEKLDWTVRASLLTILPTIILCLEPRSRRIFPLPTSVVALAFWITQPTFGGGLRELFIVLKGFSLSLIVIVVIIAINPKPPWLTLIFLFLAVLIVSFVAEETRRTCAYTLTALMMRYILYRETTTFHYIGDYYLTLLIALGFGMAAFIVPYIRWASDIARHYITVMGDSVSLSTRGVCAGFWVHSSLERQLHVARLRQLQGTITRSAARARTGLSEMGYEPHSGRYTAQLKTRMAFLKRVADILEGTMHVIEQIANDPSIIDTPMCNAFGDRLLPELHRVGAALDTTILRIVDLTNLVTETDMAAFREAHRRYDAAVDAVREEVILNNDDYHTDTSDILLGYFLFCIEELCQTVANFKEAAKPPNNVLYGLTFFVRDFNSLVTACITLVRAIWRRRTITRRLKEAIKLALCILVAALFQVYGLHNSDTSPVAGVDIIALVYNRTGGMSFQYANNRLLGTVLGSLTGLLSVQIANGRRWVLYIFVAMLSFVGSYVQTAPGYYPLGNAICNSVISIVLQYQNQNGAMVRIQQNCFAILIYFIVSSLVWPTRGRTKVKMGLDISLRMFREAVFRLMHNLDMPEDAAAVSADVTLLVGEMNKRIGVQVSNLPGALVEPTMDSADFAEMPWNMMIMTQRKLAATLSMMQQAYTTFMSSKIGTGEDKTSLSVHWVALHRISPYMIQLSDLIHAAVDIYLMTLSKATIVPTAHLTTIREGMLHCRKMILQTYIDTVQHEIAGDEDDDDVSDVDSRAGFSDSGFDYSQGNPRRGGGGNGRHASSNPFGSTLSGSFAKPQGNKNNDPLNNDSAFAPPTQVFQDGKTAQDEDTTKRQKKSEEQPASGRNPNGSSLHSSFVVGQVRHSRKGGVLGYRLRPEEEELLRQFITTGSIVPTRANVAEARIEHTMVDYNNNNSNNTPTNTSVPGVQNGTFAQRHNASSLLLSRPVPGADGGLPSLGHAQRINNSAMNNSMINNTANNSAIHAVVMPNASIVNASLTTANATLTRNPMAASLIGAARSMNSSRVAANANSLSAEAAGAQRAEALVGSDLFGLARPARGTALTNNTLSTLLPTPHHSFAGLPGTTSYNASNLMNHMTNNNASTAGAVGANGPTTAAGPAVPSLLATAQAAMTAEVNRLLGGNESGAEMAEEGPNAIPRRGESTLLQQQQQHSGIHRAALATNGEGGNEPVVGGHAPSGLPPVRRERSGLTRSPSAEPHPTHDATTTAVKVQPNNAHDATSATPSPSAAVYVDPAKSHEAVGQQNGKDNNNNNTAPGLITHVATSVPSSQAITTSGDPHTTPLQTTTTGTIAPQQTMSSSIFGADARNAIASLSASTTTDGTAHNEAPQTTRQVTAVTMHEDNIHPSEPLYGHDDNEHTASSPPHSWLPTEPLIDFAASHNDDNNENVVGATTVVIEEEENHAGLRSPLAHHPLFACDSNTDILDEEGNPVRGQDEDAKAAAKLAKEEVFDCVSCYDATQGVFVLTSRDIHSLEAFLFCVRALFMQIEEFEQHLLEMIHSNEMSKKL